MEDLPPNWTVAIDPTSGQKYYANPVTGESSWRFPGGATPLITGTAPPPPPEPPSGVPPATTLLQGRFIPPNPVMDQRFVPANPIKQQPRDYSSESVPNDGGGGDGVSTADSISALASNGLLVAAARSLSDAQARTGDPVNTSRELELYSLTAGQIADLHSVQQEVLNTGSKDTIEPYVPINAFTLPETATKTPMEVGRLEIRIHSLYDKLKKIAR